MSNKGVAPILATVLIVLVVIALAGTFLVWSQRTFTTGAERGTQETQRQTTAGGEGAQIIALDCVTNDNITVRNSGSETYDASAINIFVNNILTAPATGKDFDDTSFASKEVDTASVAMVSGDTIRVVTPRGAEDSSRCA